ncbi:hypothetical protein [uncultured Aquitalea sp.]|uniref:hypothetical protein n=1 Tax=uncultured Aquitalea sp. TaxID=540272 RepID=UPI0025F0CD03|nr:hypothetical protein [uncultured Aquitalea sp.]
MNRIEVDVTTGEERVIAMTAQEIDAALAASLSASREAERDSIAHRLSLIDTLSIRPLRAQLVGEASDQDAEKLRALEEEASDLRSQLAKLVQS